MPKLNLDIFAEPSGKAAEDAPSKEPATIAPKPKVEQAKPEPKEEKKKVPHFIPVGFYEEHLRLLDEAVLRQRRIGHWKASKSAIIRRLIERHPDELERLE